MSEQIQDLLVSALLCRLFVFDTCPSSSVYAKMARVEITKSKACQVKDCPLGHTGRCSEAGITESFGARRRTGGAMMHVHMVAWLVGEVHW